MESNRWSQQQESEPGWDERGALQSLINGEITAYWLAEAWKRRFRHNLEIERRTLWGAVNLARASQYLLTRDPHEPLPRSWFLNPESYYEANAGVRMIPATLPLNRDELNTVIRGADPMEPSYDVTLVDRVRADTGPRHPAARSDLLDRWHSWLWTPPREPRGPALPNPHAELFATAAQRASAAIIGGLALSDIVRG